jgi:hypothetical protein
MIDRSVIDGLGNIKENYFDLDSWKEWYIKFVIDVPPSFGKRKKNYESETESVAHEVLQYRKKLVNFAGFLFDFYKNKNKSK